MVNIDELRTLADSLAVVCDADTLATILDATLGADGDERLDDDQANATTMFFEYLCERRPDCVLIAQRQQGLLTDVEWETMDMSWRIKNAEDCYTDESYNVFDTFREAQEAAAQLFDIYPDGDFIVVAITKATA